MDGSGWRHFAEKATSAWKIFRYVIKAMDNADKCKELRISFAKEQSVFDPVIIVGKEVELVTSTKVL